LIWQMVSTSVHTINLVQSTHLDIITAIQCMVEKAAKVLKTKAKSNK